MHSDFETNSLGLVRKTGHRLLPPPKETGVIG